MNIFKIIFEWLTSVYEVISAEFMIIRKDTGVLIFFLALPFAYPLVYGLIYNPELVRKVPMVVVDNSRTEKSRELVQKMNATENTDIIGYAANLEEAKTAIADGTAHGILLIPEDFQTKLSRKEQAYVTLYSDMSLMIYYRGFLVSLSDVTMAMGADIQKANINDIAPAIGQIAGGSPVPYRSISIGNPQQGFGTFVMPGILVLIMQQSLLLGVGMIVGASHERRRKRGYDPLYCKADCIATVLGKAICYFLIYILPVIYLLHYVPLVFSYPQEGSQIDIYLFAFPYIFASIFLALTVSMFIYERESTFVVFVFTSIIFLFLSGVTWPRFAMGKGWYLLGNCVPSVWAMEGFVRLNGDGGDLSTAYVPFKNLWLLTGVYFVTACLAFKFILLPKARSRKGKIIK